MQSNEEQIEQEPTDSEEVEPVEDADERPGDKSGDDWKEVHPATVLGGDDVMLTALVHGIDSLTSQTKMLRHTVQTDFTLRRVRWVIAAVIAVFLLAQDVGGYVFYTELLGIAQTNQKSFQRIDKATNPAAQKANAQATVDAVNHIILCADNHIDVVIKRVPQRADCPDPSKP